MVRTRYGELVRVYRQHPLDPLEEVDNGKRKKKRETKIVVTKIIYLSCRQNTHRGDSPTPELPHQLLSNRLLSSVFYINRR